MGARASRQAGRDAAGRGPVDMTLPESLASLNGRQLYVVAALEAANEERGEAVTVGDVLAALDLEARRVLEGTYSNGLSTAVSRLLRRLCGKGIVFSPGRRGRHRYYASARVLREEEVCLGKRGSRRQRSLAFVRRLVDRLGRAVRSGDIKESLSGGDAHPDPAHLVLRDVQNLARTGELVVVGQVRGDGRGSNLYLPAELEAQREAFLPEGPLTWLEQVGRAWHELWWERLVEAEATGRKPAACSTGDLRAVFARRWPDHQNLEEPQLLVNAAGQLARGGRPVLRAFRRPGQRARLWAPADWADDDVRVDGVYAHDSERIEEAVRRALATRGTPAVTFEEVLFEVERDLALRPEQYEHPRYLLADVVKETIDHGGAGRQPRRRQRVRHVGCIENTSYFCCAGEVEGAAAFVELLLLGRTWEGLQAVARLEALHACTLPTVAAGRARLLASELEALERGVGSLLATPTLRDQDRERALELQEDAQERLRAARAWLDSHPPIEWLPEEVEDAPTWTSAEFFGLLQELYPRAPRLKDRNDAVRLFWKAVRRVPNPAYRDRWSEDPEEAALYLYDRTDALLHAARRWGGVEARLQAIMASAELGRLRDARYVLPALESDAPWDRIRGIACLAFLGSERALPHLERLAARDPDRGVRESTVWAREMLIGDLVAAVTPAVEHAA